jgi:hypothetical protein
VALVRTDVSEELSPSETSVLTTAKGRNIPENTILLLTGSVSGFQKIRIFQAEL